MTTVTCHPLSNYAAREARRQWMRHFRRVYLDRTGLHYIGPITELQMFLNCNYLPETAVYQLTGVGGAWI